MTTDELNSALAKACKKAELDRIKALILAGADPNLENKDGESIFDEPFYFAFQDSFDDELGEVSMETTKKIKEITALLVERGWNTQKYLPDILCSFGCHYTFDYYAYELFRFFLQYDFGSDEPIYHDILSGIGTEESYQRCCVHDHSAENVLYAIYECVEAKRTGKRVDAIRPYFGAVGRQIDGIVYLNDTDTTLPKAQFTEFRHDIGFVLGNALLVLREGINILFMDERLDEPPLLNVPLLFGEGVVGSRIQSITFDHNEVCHGTTHYGQPIVILELSNGKKLKFSHNFGELPNRERQSRFWVE